MTPAHRLGIDVGGTFTDLVLLDDATGDLTTEKLLTTPDEPCAAIGAALRSFKARGNDLGRVTRVVHGTTLIVNALIQRRGARVGLLTTAGFRDVLYFGREFRYDVYDRDLVFPEPLVPRHLRVEVQERIGADGTIIRALDEEQARSQIRVLLAESVEAIAICLLHSFTRSDHELRLRDLVAEEAPGLAVSLSHAVLPQIREYERCSATVMNAYVQPLAQTYLSDLSRTLMEAGCSGELALMTSAGGTMTVETASEFPLQLLESGPAAGVLIAAEVGRTSSSPNVFSFDMGGTTAKSCLIRNGEPLINKGHEVARVHRFAKGSGLPVGIPVVDLLEIGAGGGSIAELDALGLLNVGPRSAGADPGPACYGRGGLLPTVTDANVVLGLIDPGSFLGGRMSLDRGAAVSALRTHIASPLGMSVEEAALAVHRIVTENMAEAARVHSVEVNVDIRGFTMIAFGGAGPIHASGVASRLGVSTVVFPREAGVLSAWGLLTAPLAFEFARSLAKNLVDLNVDEVNHLLDGLRSTGTSLLAKAGVDQPVVHQSVDMCYVGQRYEVNTPLPVGALSGTALHALKGSFDETYEATYGRRLDQLAARCLTWRVLASGPKPHASINRTPTQAGGGASMPPTERSVIFADGLSRSCLVYKRGALVSGQKVEGPALIEEAASTLVIPPGATAVVDAWGNVRLALQRCHGKEAMDA